MNYRVVKLEPRRDGLLVFITIYNFIAMCAATAHPEDYVATAAYHDRSDMYTTAFINVSRKTGNGYTWERTDDGRYGGGYIGPAFGLVVHVTSDDNDDDHTGCRLPFVTSRKDNRELPPPGEAWIALIKRGECSFEDKVDNAYKSNAAGVLVYNNMDSATLDKMKLSTDNGRNISAVFTYKWKGERIAELIENNSKVYMHITIGGHTTSRPAINRTSVFFVSITFIVLMLISLAWLIFYYVQRFRYLHAKDLLSRRLCNAAKKALSKIPTKSIKSDDKEVQGDGECCAICIEPYKVLEVLRILPCGHEFHKSCIDPWLLEQRTCPMCKMDILKYYGFVFTGSQESILHMDTEDAVLNSGNDGSSRRSGGGGSGSGGGGISPLPQIRADHQRSFDSSTEAEDNNSSRSSSPDEMTLTLSNRHVMSARQDLCVSCKATAAAAVLVNENEDDDDDEEEDGRNLPTSVQ